MKNFLKKIVELTGYTIINSKLVSHPQRQKPITREDFFKLYFAHANSDTFFFVNIGANDGRHGDPLYSYVTKYRLHGIAIEPQPDVYKRLKSNYESYPVECVLGAIGPASGHLTFYSVKEKYHVPERPNLMTGIASFDKKHFDRGLRKKVPAGADLSVYTKKTTIRASSFEDFAREHNIDHVNCLQLDCEGMDWKILSTINLKKYNPSLINFETVNLSDADRAECERWLTDSGYTIFRSGMDTTAYKL